MLSLSFLVLLAVLLAWTSFASYWAGANAEAKRRKARDRAERDSSMQRHPAGVRVLRSVK